MYQLGQSSYELAPRNCGLGCADCGGTCAGGLGVFDGGLDWNSWGWQEWGLIFLGAYAVGSMVFTGRTGVREVKRYASRKRRARRARE
jgi:hypothetical protein